YPVAVRVLPPRGPRGGNLTMAHVGSRCRRGILGLILVAFLGPGVAERSTAAVVLYTASVDSSGGIDPISVPADNRTVLPLANPNTPPISPEVTLTPNPARL